MRPRDRKDIRFIEIKNDEDEARFIETLNEGWTGWLTVHGTQYPRYVMRRNETDTEIDTMLKLLLS